MSGYITQTIHLFLNITHTHEEISRDFVAFFIDFLFSLLPYMTHSLNTNFFSEIFLNSNVSTCINSTPPNHNCKNIQSKTSERESKENDDRGPKSRGNPLLSFLENMYRSMTNPQKIDPVRECSKFIGKYEQEYGNTHPPFSRRDFHSVVNRAHTDAKFTLVYLHCGVHQDTPTFCRKILANTALNDMLRGDNIQVWGGDVFQ